VQMNSQAILLVSDEKLSASDARLKYLAEFLGIPCTAQQVSGLNAVIDHAPDHELCVLAGVSAISDWYRNGPDGLTSLKRLLQKTRHLFLYGFSPEIDSTFLAMLLTRGQISDVQEFRHSDIKYDVTWSEPQVTKEFSGLSFGPIQNRTDFGFVGLSFPGNLRPLISIAGRPFWVALEKDGCSVFLLACKEIANIDEKITGDFDVRKYFSRLLPAAMFLKWVFKGRCWHGEHRFANFIIDDPLLQQSYGYLKYEDLLGTMDENNFATTIAFIPWNYNRTHKKIAQIFRDRSDRLSLCIHGCDHTRAEFGTSDVPALNTKVRLALNRMDFHRCRAGLEHAKIMVFPQGEFSREALMVLQSNNFLAAVNSSTSPTNSAITDELTLGDFLRPAVTKFGGVPLYQRRYPGPLERFAFDLFFDRPMLAVEHHPYLKDGGRRLTSFIAALNSLGRLEWKGLREIVENTCLQREISSRVITRKLYSNAHVIQNQCDADRTFLISKSHLNEVPVDTVFVNRRPADFELTDGSIRFPVEIPARASASVNIFYRNALPCAKPQHELRIATKVWARRVLSEFRDNVLWKSDFLMATARAVDHRFFGARLGPVSRTSPAGEEHI
jgi:hypothetical protein